MTDTEQLLTTLVDEFEKAADVAYDRGQAYKEQGNREGTTRMSQEVATLAHVVRRVKYHFRAMGINYQ